MDRKGIKLAMFEGLAIYVGKGISTQFHKHHALEIAVALEKSFQISVSKNEKIEGDFTIVSPDIFHQFIGEEEDLHLFIYFDAQSTHARFLSKQISSKSGFLHLQRSHFQEFLSEIQKWLFQPDFSDSLLLDAINDLVKKICSVPIPLRKLDPRIAATLQYIKNSLDKDVSLNFLSDCVSISPSHFAHLFKREVGIPLRQYILWCRIQSAVAAIFEGKSITEAAFKGGFSDGAHFTRTFNAMFGVPPSKVM